MPPRNGEELGESFGGTLEGGLRPPNPGCFKLGDPGGLGPDPGGLGEPGGLGPMPGTGGGGGTAAGAFEG